MSCHSLLAWRVSIERSAVILMEIHLCVICCFSLAAFNVCSLCLIFVNLINMCLGVFCLGFILFETLWVSWTWVMISFPILGNFHLLSPQVFSHGLFLSSSGTPMIWMLGHFTLSQRSLRLSSFLLILFSFFLSASLFLPFYLLPHLSYLWTLLFYYWFPPECFDLIYCIIHYWLTLSYFF